MKNLRTLLAVLLSIFCLNALAQDEPQMPPMMSDTMVDTLRVIQYGSTGSPIILIPGLASGGWVWASSVRRFSTSHVVYVVTLAGFDGMAPPAQKSGYVDLAEAELEKLIRSRGLDHPILIGHSMGGTLALLFATQHSDLISAVVTVDGLPVYPGTESIPSERRGDMGVTMRAKMETGSADAFAAQQNDYMKSEGVMDPDEGQKLALMQSRSDRFATAQYLGEDLTLDFRAALPMITVPVLLVTPYNPADGQRLNPPHTQADKVAYYRTLMAGTPKLEVVTITPARHYVMFDQRDAFLNVIGAFIDRVNANH